eukprot:TRINITY_DN863_c0_g1_i8.p1 TRINITY_DN863_c0_g1~~TRINITY_DN863_c0_g1_i8.p1  ORF type:complete len:496 (-),score=36.89 TRINITY_DN863_c0_g1_i8:1016-2503(-)
MHTDASGTGWGATWAEAVPARGFHEGARRHLHINLLELGAVRLGLLSFVDFLKDPTTLVQLKTDSRVVMHFINSGSSRSKAVMHELRRLLAVCRALGVTLRAEYLPSAVNVWADRLSRATDSTDWNLCRRAFDRFEALYGPSHRRPVRLRRERPVRALLFQAGGAGVLRRGLPPPRLGRGERLVQPAVQPLRPSGEEDHPLQPVGDFGGAHLESAGVVAGGDGRVRGVPRAAAARGGLHARPVGHASPQAQVGRGGVPIRRRKRNPVPRLERWRQLTGRLRGRRFGYGEGAHEAKLLVGAQYQPTTQARYLNSWEAFSAFCLRNDLCALPAEPETIVRYIGTYLLSGSVVPDTMANYLAAIRSVHLTAGVPTPTDDALVKAAQLGFRRLHVTNEGALPERRGPLPAAVVQAAAALGLATADESLRRECAGVILAFLMCNRPGAAANLRARDLQLTPAGFRVQVPLYKMGILKQGERIAFLIPLAEGGGRRTRHCG